MAINHVVEYYKAMEDNELTKDFYKVREFAQKIDVHPNTVYELLKRGQINAFRVGIGKRSSYRIPASEIQRLALVNMNEIIDKLIEARKKET